MDVGPARQVGENAASPVRNKRCFVSFLRFDVKIMRCYILALPPRTRELQFEEDDFAPSGARDVEPLIFVMQRMIEVRVKSRRANSNRFTAPATSVRSVVAGCCRGLQIPHRQAVYCSLDCSLLQGVASGLGSN